ncbi:MAG: hypothetical protein ABJV04_12880 [Aliiglaciecola sp.]|uniref:hypothetical protein n=1 Tax=Aliiglaciecola sp. TaxID=1872441 RepID=UPI003298F29E
MFSNLKISALIAISILWIAPSQAQVNQIPEIGAFLPSITDVKPKEVSPIDGLWTISSLDKVVRIDRGRIYAIEGWTHLFVLKIQPGMVVIHPFKQQSPGVFVGDDLPLQGPLKAILTGDRILDINVDGALGEVNYQMIPQQLDDTDAFNQLIKQIRNSGG